MKKDKNHDNLNSKKESFLVAILFAMAGLIWISIKGLYLKDLNVGIEEYKYIDFRLNYIYIITTSIGIYIVGYNRIEKIRIANNEIIDNIKKMSIVNKEKQLRHLAYYDDLTGLPNKHLLRKYLNEKSLEEDSRIGMLYIEIDDYKVTNESLGHKETELLLKKIANILYVDLVEEDYLARISENEFIVTLNKNPSKKDLERKSENILKKILRPICIEGSTIHISAKIGISLYPDISNSIEDLEKEAHLALHHIRYNSEYNYAFYNKEIGEKINKENFIINELEKAIENEDFIPYFQPISYIKDNKIIGIETLIRWNHPEKGFISPGEFIPISEDTGQIYRITYIILEKALAQKQIWNQKGFKDLKISVNISSKSFEKDNLELELKILKLLARYDIEPQELILEITETAAIQYKNVDKVLKVFNRFRGIGIKIALDDFGTGSSSLARLKELPIRYIKLDGAFVRNIGDNIEEQAIVKTVIELSRTLELIVVAEGIETMEQGKILMDIGCEIGQGYYLARPGPAEEIEKLF